MKNLFVPWPKIEHGSPSLWMAKEERVPAAEHWNQLDDLCRGRGATPKRIRTLAPFLLELPAVRATAQEFLGSADGDPAHAALHLLLCITKANGVAGLNEKNSIFARACLGLDNTLDLYTQRLNDLVEHERHRYPSSTTKQNEYCLVTMTSIATKLAQLRYYPCGRLDVLGKQFALAKELLYRSEFGAIEELPLHDRAAVLEIADTHFYRSITAVSKRFSRVEPAKRFDIMIAIIIAAPYRRKYHAMAPRERRGLVHPQVLHRWLLGTNQARPALSNRQARKSLMEVADALLTAQRAGDWPELLHHCVIFMRPSGDFVVGSEIRATEKQSSATAIDPEFPEATATLLQDPADKSWSHELTEKKGTPRKQSDDEQPKYTL